MPVPSFRVPVRVARGTISALTSGISSLEEGELCYATDQDILYIIEGGTLTATVTQVNLVSDTSPQLGGDLDTNSFEIVTVSAANLKLAPDSTGVVEVRGNTGNDAAIQLNCETNAHGVKIKSPPHSAAATYTLVLPDDTGSNGQTLTTDGSGGLSWTTASGGASALNDLSDVSYSGGSLEITGLDQVLLTSSDTPSGVTRKIYTNSTYGTVVASYTTSGTTGGFINLHETKGVKVAANNDLIYFGGDNSSSNNETELRLSSGDPFSSSPTGNYIGLKIPSGLSSDQTYTLPSADGTNGQVLTTNGSGVTSWTTASGGGGGGFTDPMTTNGDIIIRSGGSTTRLGIGSESQVLTVSSGLPVWATASGGGGGGGSSTTRLSETQTAASGAATFSGIGSSGIIAKITSSLDAWIVLYGSAAERTSDASRAFATDPSTGSGVLAEFYVTAGSTLIATPGASYFNNDTSITEAIYAAVRSQAGANVNSQVTITAYGNQALTAGSLRTTLGIGEYADDAAAGTGGVASGSLYYNTGSSSYVLKS
tara:strand:+ start:53 stop:1669 length:1617 start_codon:yes stop_codon:yes gene_type:complete